MSADGLAPVPCAGVACLRGGDVLLVRRGRPPRAGEWSIPGGRIHLGERAEDAALRELAEETGVRARLAGLIDVVDAPFRNPSGLLTRHYILIDFAAVWLEGEPRAGDDAAEARFAPVSEALDLVTWSETRRIIDAAVQLVGPG